ncbi:UNC93-like protein MFSD11 [Geodia barretti]|uniref:UNC93-like protein MFSD11 n=1 Tax=Geodia barretti TaxID=519541 RepID=A0AA35WKT9_GEOBA|nr:UNC93-like protein MFSD11 [Geodia barretti]
MFAGLTVLAIAGVLVFILITPVKRPATGYTQLDHSHPKGVLQRMGTAIRDAVQLFITKDMLLLSICFIYTGYELNFWSGVYGTIIGNTFSYYTNWTGWVVYWPWRDNWWRNFWCVGELH